jgi:hypothetical protein
VIDQLTEDDSPRLWVRLVKARDWWEPIEHFQELLANLGRDTDEATPPTQATVVSCDHRREDERGALGILVERKVHLIPKGKRRVSFDPYAIHAQVATDQHVLDLTRSAFERYYLLTNRESILATAIHGSCVVFRPITFERDRNFTFRHQRLASQTAGAGQRGRYSIG